MSPSSDTDLVQGRVRLLARVLAVVVALLMLGCVGAPEHGPLWADPGTVRLDPDHTRTQVVIHNRSGAVRPVGSFALRGDDWDTLRFVDASLPRTIPGLDTVVIELEISAASFRTEPGVYRSGGASLVFASQQFEYEVPIEFVGSEVDRRGLGHTLLTALALLALVGLLAWVPLRAGPRSEQRAQPAMRAGVAGAVMAALLVAAAIPVGLGVCTGRLGAAVGPRELAQCRAGLGGSGLLGLAASPGVWWWLIGLGLLAGAMAIVRARGSSARVAAPILALDALRLLGLALLLTALLCGLAPDDGSVTALVLAQAGSVDLSGLSLPRWGLVAQPLGFVLGVFLLAGAADLERPRDPMLAVLERLELLVWAAVLVTLYLGGPGVPGLSQRPAPLVDHGAQLLIELAAFAVELAVVVVLVDRLRAHLRALGLSPARLIGVHARWTVPLALLELVGVLIWRW